MSFSDMMSSGRGPGVIGMVMALVILLGFGILFMFAFDEGFQGAEQSDEAVIASQGKEIANYQMSIDKGQKSLELAPERSSNAKELARLGAENQTLQQTLAELAEKEKAAQVAIVEKKNEFEDYKNEYRAYVRGKAKGEEMNQLITLKGDVYKNVAIRSVTAIRMEIRHDGGLTGIPFEELPEEMKDYYQFDPAQKESAVTAENALRNQHNQTVDAANLAIDQALAKQKLEDAEKAKARAKVEIAEKKSELSTYKVRAKELENMIQQEDRKKGGLKKTGQYKGYLRDVQAKMAEIQAQIDKLSSSL